MQDVRKQDPTFTNFVPRTAAEAVDRYVRCRTNGLKPMLVPECLIACAVGLKNSELDKFEKWIINPNDDLDKVKLVRADTIRLYNNKIYKENLLRLETPPLPREMVEDEKMGEITELQEQLQETLCLSPSSPCNMILT
jgi:hypothetical protein